MKNSSPLLTYPRVKDLEYQLQTPPHFEYVGRTEGEIGPFRYVLDHFHALFYPNVHFSTVAEARQALEPLLEAWHVNALVTGIGDPFVTAFCGGEIEPAPPPPGPHPARPRAPKLSFGVERNTYPQQPRSWTLDDCTRDLAAHYEEARSGSRTLLMHGYAMLTRLESEFGRRPKVAEALAISDACLEKLQALTNTRTVEKTARKYRRGVTRIPLSPAEEQWLRSLMRELVWRSAQVAGDLPPGPAITRATRLPRAY